MEYKMAGHRVLCATCEYWMGPRQPDYFGNMVVLPDQAVLGKCWCLGSPLARADRYSNSTTCQNYKKWGILK